MLRATVVVAAAAAFTTALPSQRPTHAQVTLESELTAVAPGQESLIGVHFKIDDGWHIYWRNPGESGSAPAIKWIAPEGLTFGEIRWPVPERIVAPADTSYGYRREVVLLVPLKVSATMSPGSSADVKASIDYAICRDVCITAVSSPTMSLSIGRAAASAAAGGIAQWQSKVPAPSPPLWNASASTTQTEIILTIDTGRQETVASFLPFQNGLIADGATQVAEARATGITLHLKKSTLLSNAPSSIDGVLILADGAFEIHALVK